MNPGVCKYSYTEFIDKYIFYTNWHDRHSSVKIILITSSAWKRCKGSVRNETIQTLGTIDVQSLIFGSSLKNENENRLVFETVSKYIARI